MPRRVLCIVVLALTLGTHRVWGQSTTVEPRTPTTLLVCSWNIKWFRDTGRDLAKLAKVIAKFDLCGIIELQSDRVLQDLAEALRTETGETWIYIQSDRTGKQPSYFEEFGFLWRGAKVRLASGREDNLPAQGTLLVRGLANSGTFALTDKEAGIH